MSRIPFISALSISVALIGGALWVRFFPTNLPPAQIASVPASGQLSSADTFVEDFYDAGASLPRASTSTLSQADLLGRRLFTDFMSLKSQGQTSSDNITALADKYAESIKNTEISTPKVNLSQIVVIPNSVENLTSYGNSMINIRNRYKNLVAAQDNGGNIADITGPAFSTFMGSVGKLYQASANELLTIEVPESLVSNHMAIINSYLESAKVMKLLSDTAKDPLQAYAALNIYAQNTGQESEFLLNIQKTLMANGIISGSSI
ncbi:MAG: hypothetical protein Q7R69_01225 [bacterium]|nr:hypothetical protein [bacterium]